MKNTISPIHAQPTARYFDAERGHWFLCKHVETLPDGRVVVDAFMTRGLVTVSAVDYQAPSLSNYGIDRVAGCVTTSGVETYVPTSLLWFPVPVEVLHLPGSEDGCCEVFTEAEFQAYCLAMAE